MANKPKKRIILSGLVVLCLALSLTFSAYAWFYFPLTQNTMVFSDGVEFFDIKASVYNRTTGSFVEIPPPEGGSGNEIELKYYNDNGETVEPYFFLWGGEYTTNDQYDTIYKIVATYNNEAEAYPSLQLLGRFSFDFYCHSTEDESQILKVRSMKLHYFVPSEEKKDHMNLSNYNEFTEEDYAAGDGEGNYLELELGRVAGNVTGSKAYSITFYLLLEADPNSLSESDDIVGMRGDEDGLIFSSYSANMSFICRTIPANIYDPDAED